MPKDSLTRFTGDQNLKIEYRATASLSTYVNNARVHSRAQIKKIATSLRTFGWTNPLIIDQDGMVLCGHGRLEAAKLIGLDVVPVIMLDHLSEAERKAYIIADNSIAEQASWSKIMLRNELKGLAELGYELELTGFDTLRIDTLLSLDDDTAEPDEIVPLPDETRRPVTRLGDHWIVGDQQLICGDARDQGVYETLMAGELAQLIITDPPYNSAPERISKTHGAFVGGSGELSDTEFSMGLLRPAMRCLKRWSKAGAIAFIFMDWRGGPRVLEAAEGIFHEQKNLIVWVKSNAGMGTFYRSQHELVHAFKVNPGQHINTFGLGGASVNSDAAGRHRSNVWTYAGANTFRKGRKADLEAHPTVKPRKLLADAILDCSTRGGIVLDCFAGSGSVLLAAQMTGRRGRVIELDPKYCDIILDRLAAETGIEPRLADGTTLSEVTRARAIQQGAAR